MEETGGIEKVVSCNGLISSSELGWCHGNGGKGTEEYIGLVFIFIANIYFPFGIIF